MSRSRSRRPDPRTEFFFEGYNAYHDGTDESKNPYPSSDERHLSWNDGWAAARGEGEGLDPFDQDKTGGFC